MIKVDLKYYANFAQGVDKMCIVFGAIFLALLSFIIFKSGKYGTKVFVGYLIFSWLFIIIFGLIPFNADGTNLIGSISTYIGMPTSGTLDSVLTWKWQYQLLFAIGGILYISCPVSLAIGILCGLGKLFDHYLLPR